MTITYPSVHPAWMHECMTNDLDVGHPHIHICVDGLDMYVAFEAYDRSHEMFVAFDRDCASLNGACIQWRHSSAVKLNSPPHRLIVEAVCYRLGIDPSTLKGSWAIHQ